MGKIVAICTSEKKGTQKLPVKEAVLKEAWGIEQDAHAGKWHRQVSLLSFEKIEEFRNEGAEVNFGAFGENLVISGYDLNKLPIGTGLACGDVVLEVTQIGKECHTHCAIYHTMGKCIMPTQGIFARVIRGGVVKEGDEIVLVEEPLSAAVITLSDKGSRGERRDESGPLVQTYLENTGYQVMESLLLNDDKEALKKELIRLADERKVNLILTTGGTGFSLRDNTPEATLEVADRNVPGIAEAIRAYSMSITKRGMLSRGVSVLRGKTLIVNLPGSPKAVKEILDYILEPLNHGLKIADGSASECAIQSK